MFRLEFFGLNLALSLYTYSLSIEIDLQELIIYFALATCAHALRLLLLMNNPACNFCNRLPRIFALLASSRQRAVYSYCYLGCDLPRYTCMFSWEHHDSLRIQDTYGTHMYAYKIFGSVHSKILYIHESSESISPSARLLVVFGFFIHSSLHLIHTWSSSSVLPNPRRHLLKTLNMRISSESK